MRRVRFLRYVREKKTISSALSSSSRDPDAQHRRAFPDTRRHSICRRPTTQHYRRPTSQPRRSHPTPTHSFPTLRRHCPPDARRRPFQVSHT
ncbi:hypothetical protein B0H19DRAFT_417676 [Mycena capillaripes]|nr:hypothetical protein B0H19DRAFT_417676 [Mycena capillaripes]